MFWSVGLDVFKHILFVFGITAAGLLVVWFIISAYWFLCGLVKTEWLRILICFTFCLFLVWLAATVFLWWTYYS